MFAGDNKKKLNVTVKWDGAPAIFAGPHPETGKFFVAKKSLFNKKPEWYSKKNTLQKFNIEPTYLSPRLQF